MWCRDAAAGSLTDRRSQHQALALSPVDGRHAPGNRQALQISCWTSNTSSEQGSDPAAPRVHQQSIQNYRPQEGSPVSTTVADHLLERLREWQVEHVFGYAGDGINGLLSAWEKAGDRPRFVQARHEEMAAFEAVGYAKFTGRVGVCTATSGPGAIHLLNGLYDAKLDHVPVVAIVGQTARSAMGGSYQQEVDLHTLFKDVAADYCETVMVPEQLPNVLD